MASDWTLDLSRLRRRIKLARTVEQAVRWTFYASVFVCVLLTVLKITARTVAPPLAIAAIGAAAAAAIAIEVSRRFTLSDCALLLDVRLRLDERLSTALVAEGPMAEAVRRDAGRAFAAADRRAVVPRAVREIGRLAGALVFVAALLAAPALAPAPDSLDPELAAAARREARKLRETGDAALAAVALELEEAKTPGAIRAALAKVWEVEAKAGGKGGEATAAAAAAAAAAGAALSSALARRGRLPPELDAAPPALARKLEGNAGGVHAGGPGAAVEDRLELGPVQDVAVRDAARRAISRRSWSPEYDEVVAAYFEVRR